MPLTVLARAAALALTLGLSACTVLGSSGPTEVARGEYYAAGKPEYDAFFIELHRKYWPGFVGESEVRPLAP